ncbi:MAG: SpoVG family protein [Lachnospiraceae bacterium]|nr:SpoVG family protein [Lachnospiraceae bacterium]
MKVTDVRLSVINSDNAVRAIGSFTLDESFVIKGIRVMEGKDGKNFVSFPSRAKADGTYEDVAFPLNKELYTEIVNEILNTYQKVMDEMPPNQEQAKQVDLPDEKNETKKKGKQKSR